MAAMDEVKGHFATAEDLEASQVCLLTLTIHRALI